MPTLSNRSIASLAIVTNVFIWAAALPIIKPALNHVDPYEFLFLRYLIAAPLMLPLIWYSRPKPFKKLYLTKPALIESIQIVFQLTLLYEGLKLTTAIEASLLNASAPVFITIGGILFLREIQERNEWYGLILSIIGTVVIIITPYLHQTNEFGLSHLGNTFVLLSVLCWTTYILLAKKFYHHISKLFATGISSWIGLIFFGSITLINQNLTHAFYQFLSQPSVFFSAIYMGVLGTPVAVSLYLWGQDRIEASEATLFSYLAPVIYIPLTVFWLGEKIIPAQLLGLVIITLGVIIAQFRARPVKY